MLRKWLAMFGGVLTCLLMELAAGQATAQDAGFTRKQDVIYGRKYGTALTMDVFTPQQANGAAVIWAVSGGFFSSHDNINPGIAKPILARGYTVFAVVHGSQPRFQIPDIVQDMERSVRFIRHHAKEYGIDPNRIGVSGGSAGGHLSLMLGTAGKPGDPNAKDPVDRESSRVQAVACFFPPSDFLNWGAPSKEMIHAMDHRAPFRASFDYHERNQQTNMWERITDENKLRQIAHDISPIYHVSSESAPTLIIHGDKDDLVPLQQAEVFIAKLKETGVEGKLVVKQGAGHGWPDMQKDLSQLVDWFDGHLKNQTAPAGAR